MINFVCELYFKKFENILESIACMRLQLPDLLLEVLA